jgi:hypothetical protein
MTPRIIAVDWSGAKVGAASKIWLAEARDGVLLRLKGGRDRDELVRELIALKRRGDPLVVGLDFGFSFPAWFMRDRGFASAPDAWRWLARVGCADDMLSACRWPFWGRKGSKRTEVERHFRLTEEACTSGADRPKSIFQINGGGAVGTGSLRGMCKLFELRNEGFAIWPFDECASSTVIEIFPRILYTRPIRKTRRDERVDYVEKESGIPARLKEEAARTDDAFDAAISAIAMSKHVAALAELPLVDDPELRLEGIIWWPAWREAHAAAGQS